MAVRKRDKTSAAKKTPAASGKKKTAAEKRTAKNPVLKKATPKTPSGDSSKTKAELIKELQKLRRQTANLQKAGETRGPQTAKTLLKTDERFELLYNGISDAIFIHEVGANGKLGKLIEVNNEACRRLGYSKKELLRMTPLDIDAPESEVDVVAISKALSKGKNVIFEQIHMKKDGTRVPVEINARAFTLEGRPTCMSIARDISERKLADEALRESEEKFREIISSTRAGYFFIDTDGIFRDVNDAWLHMHGYESSKEIVGKHFSITQVGQDIEKARELVRMLIEEKKMQSGEFSRRLKDGSVGYHTFTVRPVIKENRVVGIEGFLIDDTERKKVEAGLRLHSEIISNMSEGVYLVRASVGIIVYCNLRFEEMFGYGPGEMLGKHVSIVNAPTEGGTVGKAKEIMGSIDKNGYWEGEILNIKKDGTPFWCSASVSIFDHYEHGKVLVSVHADITDRKRAEEALRESEEKFRVMFESSNDGIVIADVESKMFFTANDAFCRMLGYSPGEIARLSVSDIHPEQALPLVTDMFERMARGEITLAENIPVKKSEGQIIYADISATPVKLAGETCMVGFFRDITERKWAEELLKESAEELRYSEGFLQSIIDTEPECVKLLDSDGRLIMMNRSGLRMLEADSLEQIRGEQIYEFIAPEYREEFRSLTERVCAGEKGQMEFEMISLKGNRFWLETHAVPFNDIKNNRTLHLGITRDITERKEAEAELKRKSLHIQKLLDAFPCFAVILRPDREIVALNRVAREMGGKIGMKCFKTLGKGDKPCPWCRATLAVERQEMQHIQTWGDGIFWDAYWIPFDEDLYLHFAFDITESEKMKEEMLKAQKLESVGVLAGGIAHDFNNLLTGVFGTISLAKMYSDRNGKAFHILEDTERVLKMTKGLTHQLLTFAKGGTPVTKTIDIVPVINDTVMLALSGSKTKSKLFVPDGLPAVEADEGQLAQALQNILINARESMPEGGTVKVTADKSPVTDESGLPIPEGDYLSIIVSDTGIGIPEEHMDRIFDPYFTTKQAGSGLGLAAAYSIIAKHGGHLRAESTLGIGSTFTIYLPVSANAPPAKKAQERETAGPQKASGRVLVMDDEEVVRFASGQMLQALGYEASFAEDGAVALEQYMNSAKKGRPFDAVILDLTVPGAMGGEDTIKKLLESDPDVKAIVSSGYADDKAMADFAALGFKAALTKPYDLDELRNTLNKVITD